MPSRRRSSDCCGTFPTMPPRGEVPMIAPASASGPYPLNPIRRAADSLHEARNRERAGCITEAIACYESAIAAAEQNRERGVLAEALRRLAVIRYHRGDSAGARQLCH